MENWKKWSVIVPVLMTAIMLLSTPLSALAAADEDTAPADTSWQGALAIIAPWKSPVSEEVSMRVFLREDQEPFEGAGVWALTEDEAETMREEVTALNSDAGTAAEDKDYEAIADIHGTLIGRTDEDGRLYHTFDAAGVYVLAAVKRGYLPGFTRIRVGVGLTALAIRAPEKAAPGEEVVMTVYQKNTEETVSEAGIWAIYRENVEALSEDIKALREETGGLLEDTELERIADIHGTFLGRTDDGGQLGYTFEDEGGYLLVAIHSGFLPGRTHIRIGEDPLGLSIWAPLRALVNEEVAITVYQRDTTETVEDAGIWAITRGEAETLKEELAALKEDGSLSAGETDFEAMVDLYGFNLGRTDENGKLEYAFDEEGDYVLVAVKAGYIPGFSPIRIVSLPLTRSADGNANAPAVRQNVKAEAAGRAAKADAVRQSVMQNLQNRKLNRAAGTARPANAGVRAAGNIQMVTR
jgi:hypothetical protein